MADHTVAAAAEHRSGRNVVLLTASTALAALLEHHTAIPTSAVSMTPDAPATVNHTALTFRLRIRENVRGPQGTIVTGSCSVIGRG